GTFKNAGGTALQASAIKVTGSVFLRNGCSVEGEVNLIRAEIGGSLDCYKGTFKNAGGIALQANSIKVTGSVFLRDDCGVEGEVNLVRAEISGNLECSGGRFAPESLVNLEQA